jgi:DNA-binding Xre family transcriptional regulator
MERIEIKLNDLLKEMNYPKWRLARLSGVDYRTILKYCKGEVKNIKLDNLLNLCKTLDCTVGDIIEYKKD